MFRVLFSTVLIASNLLAFAVQAGVEKAAHNFNGAVTESSINDYMKSNGARQINAEVGRHGIDGLFYKKVNGKLKVFTIESKYNNATQAKTLKGMQMEEEWKLAKIDEKIKSIHKQVDNNKLSSKEAGRLKKELGLLKKAKMVVNEGKDVSLLFRIKPLAEEYKELVKESVKRNRLAPEKQRRLEELQRYKSKGTLNSKYKTTIKKLDPKTGKTIGDASRYGFHNKTIDLKKQYKIGSAEHKQQKIISHNIRKEKRLIKEKVLLESTQTELKQTKKDIPKYKALQKKIDHQKAKIVNIENSTPKYRYKNKSITKLSVSQGRKFVKIFSSGAKRTSGIIIAKMGALSAASAIPFVGVAAQIAADMYMASQIEDLHEKTEENEEHIAINSQYISVNRNNIAINAANIKRVAEEVQILGNYVSLNQVNIERAFEEVTSLHSKLEEFEKEIRSDRDSKFQSALDELNTYFNSEKQDQDRLISAIGKFDEILQNPNYSSYIKLIVRNSLNIAEIEQVYLLRKENKSTSKLDDKILDFS